MKRINIKMICFAAMLLVCTATARAQGLGNWFNQKKTQTKYLVQQIVALQVYLSYLKKGYDVTRDGLNLIGDIKNGEFDLHKDYFNSLKTVNPKIMKYPKITGILSMQMIMLQQYHEVMKQIKASGQFTGAEIIYIKKVYDNVENEAVKDLDELQLVTANGEMEMTDGERIRQIDNIYKQVQDKFSFLRSFSQLVRQLAAARKQGKADAKVLMQLYGQQ